MWLRTWVLESDRHGYESWLYVLLTVCDLGKPLRAWGLRFLVLKRAVTKYSHLPTFQNCGSHQMRFSVAPAVRVTHQPQVQTRRGTFTSYAMIQPAWSFIQVKLFKRQLPARYLALHRGCSWE